MDNLGRYLLMVAFLTVGQASHALTSVSPSCSFSTVIANPGGAATDCSGAWAGNDAQQQAGVLAQISSDWGLNLSFLGTTDDAGNGPFTSNPQTASGTLTFDNLLSGPFVLSLKASNQFSLFLFDGTFSNVMSVSFTTDGVSVNGSGRPQDLSHASLFGTISPVPEPGIYAMTGLGLGVLAWLGRKKRLQQSATAAG